MKLMETYQAIQRVIVMELLELLRVDGEETVEEWLKKKEGRADEIEKIALGVLTSNRQRVMESVIEDYSEAEQLIAEHVKAEWGIEYEEEDPTAYLQETLDYLNENIIRSLCTAEGSPGIVVGTYEKILEQVRETDKKSEDEVLTVIGAIIYAQLENGFYSGFYQSDGLQWRMDRYIQQIDKHIYQDTYNRVMRRLLYGYGVELVKVYQFANPREACEELQQSGIICIVPRDEASEEALEYPNIHDSKHKTGQPDGHRGINCRHLWHSLDGEEDRTQKLYDVVDSALMSLEVQRLLFNKMLRKYL